MEEKEIGRRRKESREWQTYLPLELWIQILCFLPVKSLLVLRSVSKFFFSIIEDPNFVSLHLRKFPGNLDETLTLVQRTEFRCCPASDIGRIRYEIRESNGFALTGKLDPGLRAFDSCILTGSLDGLFLLTTRGGDEVARLWNPSTRKVRSIPIPTPISLSKATGWRLTGLAYDSSCEDYKVLYIPYNCNFLFATGELEVLGIWVYSVKTRSWTTIDIESSGLATIRAHSRYPWSLFFEGGLLWIEGWYSAMAPGVKEYCIRMVRFDLATHKFSYHTDPLPCPAEKHKRMETKLVTLDGGSSLGLCGLDDHDLVSIWAYPNPNPAASASSSSSWVQRCVIHQCPLQSFYHGTFVRVTKNDDLTWKYSTADGGIKIVTFNIRTHHCLQTHISPSNSASARIHEGDHCAFVESLVML